MIYNSHIHTFRDIDIPNHYLPAHLCVILRNKFINKIFGKALTYLIPFTDNDLLDRYAKFLEAGVLGSQHEIFENVAQYYPDDTKFFVLSMDMAYMGAGKVPNDYENQLKELTELRDNYKDNILPFIHIDPRRLNCIELFKKYIELHGFVGPKIYCNLGYFPYDENLIAIYQYCEQHQIPVMAHGSPYNPVHYRGSKNEIKTLLKNSKVEFDTHNKTKKELCSFFNHPKQWEHVIAQFPKLKICFAHFGSESEWISFLEQNKKENNWFLMAKEMIKKYDNFYADISFTAENRNIWSLLSVLLEDDTIKNKILFGSDYYMNEVECNERQFAINLRAFLGENKWRQISELNTKNFLGV